MAAALNPVQSMLLPAVPGKSGQLRGNGAVNLIDPGARPAAQAGARSVVPVRRTHKGGCHECIREEEWFGPGRRGRSARRFVVGARHRAGSIAQGADRRNL